MNNNPHIVVIDDEIQIRKLLNITLSSAGYYISEAGTGKEGMQLAAIRPPDLLILDLGLPDNDGKEILRQIRDWYSAPVIILSVRDSEEEIVQALDLGANDYLIKPFRTGELLARIRSCLRHSATQEQSTIIKSGSLSIDLSSRVVKKNNVSVKLTATEYSLLSLLARNDNKVLTHQFILKEIWGPSYIEQSQYLRVFIGQIRKKIEDDPNHPLIILTEPSIGYRFVCD
ncbi:Transcriptional regulatory protein KdpE [bioreactor metagenome]|uniref:Transcriptional regulatory protein KdpE n=1 Tax=bioreactor metagenome TaxID=1076179 RepID=A0A644YP84_9ZZZZ